MSIISGTSDFAPSNVAKQMQSRKKPGTTKSIYSGISNAKRTIQQQRQYWGSTSSWQSKRNLQRSNIVVTKTCDPPVTTYHPWESDYNKVITRERRLKPMAKDPYTLMLRSISRTVEKMTTEAECHPILIPAKAVKKQTVKIRTVKTREVLKGPPSQSRNVRYLRRDELMPSEQINQGSNSERIALSPEPEDKTPVISFVNINKAIDVAPKLTVAERLLNRAKMRTDPSVIRRPPRRLIINAAQETIMPLSVCG